MAVISVEGEVSTGKSVALYTGPLPLVSFAFDAGAVRALYGSLHNTYFKGIDIRIIPYPHMINDAENPLELVPIEPKHMPVVRRQWKRNDGKAITIYLFPSGEAANPQSSSQLSVEGAVPKPAGGYRMLWQRFKNLALEAIWDREIMTVGIDTGTAMRDAAADAYLEVLQATPATAGRKQLIQIEFRKVNDMCREIYSSVQQASESFQMQGTKKVFVITNHLAERRQNVMTSSGEPTSVVVMAGGKPVMDLKGLSTTYDYVDIAIRNERVTSPGEGAGAVPITSIKSTVVKSGIDLSLTGSVMMNPTYASIATRMNRNINEFIQLPPRNYEVPKDAPAEESSVSA